MTTTPPTRPALAAFAANLVALAQRPRAAAAASSPPDPALPRLRWAHDPPR